MGITVFRGLGIYVHKNSSFFTTTWSCPGVSLYAMVNARNYSKDTGVTSLQRNEPTDLWRSLLDHSSKEKNFSKCFTLQIRKQKLRG